MASRSGVGATPSNRVPQRIARMLTGPDLSLYAPRVYAVDPHDEALDRVDEVPEVRVAPPLTVGGDRHARSGLERDGIVHGAALDAFELGVADHARAWRARASFRWTRRRRLPITSARGGRSPSGSAREIAPDRAPERDGLGAAGVARQLAHRGRHQHEAASRIDVNRLAADGENREHPAVLRKDPGLIAVAGERRRGARAQVRLVGAHAGRISDPGRRHDLAPSPVAVVGEQETEPRVVAQHGVEAAE